MSTVKRKSGFHSTRPRKLQRPSTAQILRQLGVIAAVLIIWAGLLVGFLNLTGRSAPEPTASASPTRLSADTPQPSATPTDAATATELPPTTEPATDLPAAAETSTPAPTATNTAEPPTDTPTPAAPSSQFSFAADVLPILETRCAQCHGPERVEGGLRLDSYASVMAGSENGLVIVRGDAAASLLVRLIESGDMPRRNPRLVPADIQTIRDWIDAGAADN